MLKYIGLHKYIIKINFICLFLFFNMAARKFQSTYVVCVIFLLGSPAFYGSYEVLYLDQEDFSGSKCFAFTHLAIVKIDSGFKLRAFFFKLIS